GVGNEARRVLAALAGVALAADAVHGDGQRLVRLPADRAVRHGAGLEALQDRLDRLDLLERHRLSRRLQVHEAAQRAEVARLIVDEPRVLLEHLEVGRAAGELQLVDALRVEEMKLAVAAILVLPARIEAVLGERAFRESAKVALADLGGDLLDADPLDARGGPGEV